MSFSKTRSLMLALILLVSTHSQVFAEQKKALTMADANKVAITLINISTVQLVSPGGLALSPRGVYLLVADQGAGVIKIFDPGRLKLLSEFGKDELKAPSNVMFNKKGELLVVDTGNDRVVRYRFEGVFRDGSANAERLGVVTEKIVFPYQEFIDEELKIWQVDGAAHQIKVFDRSNKPLGFFGTGAAGAGRDQLNAPSAITVEGRYLWVSDTGNKRIMLLKNK